MPLRIAVLKDFCVFWMQNGDMLASKIEQKSMLSSRDDFLKKMCFPNGKTSIFKDPGVEVGSPNRSKIDQNLKSNIKCLGIDFSSIFVDFGGQVGFQNPPKIDPKWHRKKMKNRSVTK